jgi:ring-1,2-phenylacetyl-CoA epoxidase subunit PaaE
MLTFHPLRVAELHREASDAVCIALEVPDHLQEAYRFVPGQHLGIRANVNGQELRRTYSICSAFGEKHLRIGVRVHDQGGMSRHLAYTVQVGDVLDVLTPTGRFFAQPGATAAKTYCAFAGGSGITPILGIIRNVLAREPHSRCLLFYGNRTTATIMFAEELLALKDCYIDRLSLYFVLSREPQDVELFNGRLDREKVALLGTTLFEPRAVDAFYLCGPGTMLDSVREALLCLGVDGVRIHAERYATEAKEGERSAEEAVAGDKRAVAGGKEAVAGGKEAVAGDSRAVAGDSRAVAGDSQAVAGDSPSKQGQSPQGQSPQGQSPQRQYAQGQSPQGQSPQGQSPQGQSPQGQSAIQVTVVMDGRRRSFAMPGSGTTVLEAAESEGLDLPYSCRAGVCSTCRTKVTRGEVTMKENYALEPWEVDQGYVLCCQALPASAELELTYDER